MCCSFFVVECWLVVDVVLLFGVVLSLWLVSFVACSCWLGRSCIYMFMLLLVVVGCYYLLFVVFGLLLVVVDCFLLFDVV